MRSAYLALFFLVCVAPAHAYIDPGTGSMLFSALAGIVVTGYFFLKNVALRLKGLPAFLRGGAAARSLAGKRTSVVFYSEGRQYYNVLWPLFEELRRRNVDCGYLTSDEGDPALSGGREDAAVRCIGKGHAAYLILNKLEADVCVMTTPGLDVYHLKRSPGVRTYVHVFHAVNDPTLYRLFGLDYYDAVLLTGAFQEAPLKKLEELRGSRKKSYVVAGCTYLDVLSAKAAALGGAERKGPAEGPTVLVSPSWGANAILARYGEKLLRPLAESGLPVIVRPHPQSLVSEKDLVAALKAATAAYPNVEWDEERENLKAMSRSDVMISDFSGIVFDYAFLFGKPVIYPAFEMDLRPYDAGDLDGELWTARVLREIGERIEEADFPRVAEIARAAAGNAARAEAIAKAREEAWAAPGEAAVLGADAIQALRLPAPRPA